MSNKKFLSTYITDFMFYKLVEAFLLDTSNGYMTKKKIKQICENQEWFFEIIENKSEIDDLLIFVHKMDYNLLLINTVFFFIKLK